MVRRRVFAWTVVARPQETGAVYANLSSGAARRCGCPACLNFDVARPAGFPSSFRKVLVEIGVDLRKEQDVRLVSPLEQGTALYTGSYMFCGEILAGRPYRGFPFLKEEVDVFERVGPGLQVALRRWLSPEGAWAPHPTVRVEFLAVLPWLLDSGGVPAVDLGRDPAGFTS